MYVLKSPLVIGTSAVIAWVLATYPADLTFGFLRDGAASSTARGIAASVNRTQKSDRLAATASARAPARTISTVELVGLRDAAIIYRDRDGRVLFQSDPLSNITMISKGVVLPEITLRETAGGPARTIPLPTAAKRPQNQPAASSEDARPQPAATPVNAPKKIRIPEGCDPAASPIAAPQMSQILSKCIVEGPATTKIASLM